MSAEIGKATSGVLYPNNSSSPSQQSFTSADGSAHTSSYPKTLWKAVTELSPCYTRSQIASTLGPMITLRQCTLNASKVKPPELSYICVYGSKMMDEAKLSNYSETGEIWACRNLQLLQNHEVATKPPRTVSVLYMTNCAGDDDKIFWLGWYSVNSVTYLPANSVKLAETLVNRQGQYRELENPRKLTEFLERDWVTFRVEAASGGRPDPMAGLSESDPITSQPNVQRSNLSTQTGERQVVGKTRRTLNEKKSASKDDIRSHRPAELYRHHKERITKSTDKTYSTGQIAAFFGHASAPLNLLNSTMEKPDEIGYVLMHGSGYLEPCLDNLIVRGDHNLLTGPLNLGIPSRNILGAAVPILFGNNRAFDVVRRGDNLGKGVWRWYGWYRISHIEWLDAGSDELTQLIDSRFKQMRVDSQIWEGFDANTALSEPWALMSLCVVEGNGKRMSNLPKHMDENSTPKVHPPPRQSFERLLNGHSRATKIDIDLIDLSDPPLPSCPPQQPLSPQEVLSSPSSSLRSSRHRHTSSNVGSQATVPTAQIEDAALPMISMEQFLSTSDDGVDDNDDAETPAPPTHAAGIQYIYRFGDKPSH